MKTYLDCIPCFFRQAIELFKNVGIDEIEQKKIIDKIARLVPSFSLDTSPPEKAREIYNIIYKAIGQDDPFFDIKEKSNKSILSFYPKLKEKVEESNDRLLTAIELAIIGNIIDYGVREFSEVDAEINKLCNNNFSIGNKAIFEYDKFKSCLASAQKILYLADNAGEIVFDRLLLSELKKNKKQIVFAVKEKPVINDALIKDAYDCGINEYASIITNGSDAPGTILKLCSPLFCEHFKRADLIISKGQGNYETLSEVSAPIFFMLKVKCRVAARHIGCEIYSTILKYNN